MPNPAPNPPGDELAEIITDMYRKWLNEPGLENGVTAAEAMRSIRRLMAERTVAVLEGLEAAYDKYYEEGYRNTSPYIKAIYEAIIRARKEME